MHCYKIKRFQMRNIFLTINRFLKSKNTVSTLCVWLGIWKLYFPVNILCFWDCMGDRPCASLPATRTVSQQLCFRWKALKMSILIQAVASTINGSLCVNTQCHCSSQRSRCRAHFSMHTLIRSLTWTFLPSFFFPWAGKGSTLLL